MKKLFTVTLALAVSLSLLIAGTAKAGPNGSYVIETTISSQADCSRNPISADKTFVWMATDPHTALASMLIVAKDAEGKTLCNLDQTMFTTSRNMYATSNGWPSNVDVMDTHQNGGIIITTFRTTRPAGTTVYAEVNNVAVGNQNGMPFCYMNCNIPPSQ